MLAFALVGLVGALDWWSGLELDFSVFYLAPILIMTWYAGRAAGVVVALLCAAMWSIAYFLSQTVNENPIIPYWHISVWLLMFLIMVQMLSALKAALAHERELARTDSLTGVANSRAFYERVEIEIARARRYKRTFTVAYIDVDNFKLVNDRYGHRAGDDLLCTVAQVLRGRVRETDMVARLGGDEFAILFVETGYQVAQLAIARVQKALMDTAHKQSWPVSFSIGAVTCSGHVESVDSVIRRADELMYTVKRSNKNSIRHERYHVTEQVA